MTGHNLENRQMKSKPMSRRLVATVLAAAFAGAVLGVPAQAQTAPRKPFRVVTTFTIIQDIAQNVAGDRAIVESITKPGAEIHDYQPTPLDIVRAQAADLVLWNGFNLERWFEKFFENVKQVPSVVVTEGIEPMGITEGPYSGKPNPHAWMSSSTRADLCRKHPQGAGQIRPGQRGILFTATPRNTRRGSRRSTSPCASGSPPSPKTSAGWCRAKAHSAT